MNAPAQLNGGAGAAPRTWLAAMGVAATFGSEPMIGWQWYRRLKSRGDVTVLTAKIWDHDDFLAPEHRADMVFIDTGATSRAEWASHFGRHLWRWWRGTRAYLKAHAGPDDRLLIVVPAAIWMLPWLNGLPMRRDRVFFGPLGIDWVSRPLRGSWLPGLRNLRTVVFLALWRLLAPWLPKTLALRAPFPKFEAMVGRLFRVLGAVPEIEPPSLAIVTPRRPPAAIAVLFDQRPRKRFAQSLARALQLAAETALPLVIIGLQAGEEAGIAAQALDAGVAVRFQPRLGRDDFRDWLADTAPHFVSLSASEGIPSTLIEVLLAGGRLHVHDVGGIHWLQICGVDRTESLFEGAPVISFAWNDQSVRDFEAHARHSLESLLDNVLAGDNVAVRR